MPINIWRKYEAITWDSNQILWTIIYFLTWIGIVLLIEFSGKTFLNSKNSLQNLNENIRI